MRELIERTVGPGIPVTVKVSTEDASILCDPGQLESAVINLLCSMPAMRCPTAAS